ncbi:MAG: DUF1573 domain-containing protein, partial [Planctomycetes bacterium]|nr:DUF1573 domain-containing protein [Planctomycetota bacterium]
IFALDGGEGKDGLCPHSSGMAKGIFALSGTAKRIFALPFFVLPLLAVAAPQDSDHQPRAYVEVKSLDLGVLKEGVVVPVSYLLENRGNAVLIIDRAKGDCGCTVVRLSEEEKTILPGQSITIKADFNTAGRAGPGVQTKTITVYTNDPIEQQIELKFTAQVMSLFRRLPTGHLILPRTQRGREGGKSIDLTVGSVGLPIEVVGVKFDPPVPLIASFGPFSERGRTGQRIIVAVAQNAPLGTILSTAVIRLMIGEEEIEERVGVRVEVVGDLIHRPLVVDTTRSKSLRGQRLVPVTVESAGNVPFKVVSADAPAILDVIIQQSTKRGRIIYTIQPVIRQDAPAGPFGTTLRIHTDSLDQPLLTIPVYGLVAPPIQVNPSRLMLRMDGTAIGMNRRVKLQATKPKAWEVIGVESSHPFVSAKVDKISLTRYNHISYLLVTLVGEVPPGTHEVELTVLTNFEGAERLSIPVKVLGPESGDSEGS